MALPWRSTSSGRRQRPSKGSGDRNPLPLPSRERGRLEVRATGESDQLQRLVRAPVALGGADACIQQAVGHVLAGGRVLGQEELLEDEPDLTGPEARQLAIAQKGGVDPADPNGAAAGPLEGSHDVEVHDVAGHGAVTIQTVIHPGCAQLTVENTGEQLTPEVVATLTEPFQRGTARVRGDYPGVGLGLSIVKSIVQAHHGALTLTPREAGGLCVTVLLPAAPAAEWERGSGRAQRDLVRRQASMKRVV